MLAEQGGCHVACGTVPELLDGHTVLDIEYLDRIYLNGYVPRLQVGGQVVTFLHDAPRQARAFFEALIADNPVTTWPA